MDARRRLHLRVSGITLAVLLVVPLGRPQGHTQGASGPVYALGFSPDLNILASGGFDRVSKLWDPRTMRQPWPAA
jgi:WD40 repeat protein